MVSYSVNEFISTSDLEKDFDSYLKLIKDKTVEKLVVQNNNKVEAIIISKDEYESMIEALKEAESQKILSSINNGLIDIKTKIQKVLIS